jgi:hypothetical protein
LRRLPAAFFIVAGKAPRHIARVTSAR